MSRYPTPELANLPDDIRAKVLEVQEKAGFVPNVFLALARRPVEWRAFFAYHDALMLKEDSGLSKGDQWDGRSHLSGIVMCQSGGVYQPT